MKLKVLYSIALCTLFSAIPLYAIEPILINEYLESLNITKQVQYFEDKSAKAAIEDITDNKKSIKWIQCDSESVNFGYSSSAYWFRIITDNKTDDGLNYYLEIAYDRLTRVDLYLKKSGSGYKSIRAGNSLPFHVRQIEDRNTVFHIKEKPGKNTYYVRVETASSINFPINIWSPESFLKRLNRDLPILWILYGFMIVMIFYNVFIFLYTREQTYIYYILLIVSLLLLQLILNGFAFQYLWPDSVWLANNALPYVISITLISFCLFFRAYLDTRRSFIFMDKLLVFTTIIPCTVIFIACLSGHPFILDHAKKLLMIITLYSTVTMFLSSGIAAFRGSHLARFFLFGFGLILLGTITLLLKQFGFIPSNPFTRGIMLMASSLMVVFFSLGLAEKIRVLKNTLSDLNINLENKVIERTEELEAEKEKLRHHNMLMDKEVDLARIIQNEIVPQISPINYIYSLYKPMSKVGGDFFDFIKFRDSDNVGIFISDVSGHGVPAAFITTMIKTVILQAGEKKNNPSELMYFLNDILYNRTGGNFCTAFYGIYDPDKRSLTYSIAGHNRPYIIKENSVSQLKGIAGIPIGIMENSMMPDSNKAYKNIEEILPVGSKLLMYTDGFTEARSLINNTFFDECNIDEVLLELNSFPCDKFIKELYIKLTAFRGADSFDDDVCLLCLDVN